MYSFLCTTSSTPESKCPLLKFPLYIVRFTFRALEEKDLAIHNSIAQTHTHGYLQWKTAMTSYLVCTCNTLWQHQMSHVSHTSSWKDMISHAKSNCGSWKQPAYRCPQQCEAIIGQFLVCLVAWHWKDSTNTVKCAIRNIPSSQQKWMYQYFFKSTLLSFPEKTVGVLGYIYFFTCGGKGSCYLSFPRIGFPITQFAHENDGMDVDRKRVCEKRSLRTSAVLVVLGWTSIGVVTHDFPILNFGGFLLYFIFGF